MSQSHKSLVPLNEARVQAATGLIQRGLALADSLTPPAPACICGHCGASGSEDTLTEMINQSKHTVRVCRRACYQVLRRKGYVRLVTLTHPLPRGFGHSLMRR